MSSRSQALAAASLLTVLALSGCGGSDADPAAKDDKTTSAAPDVEAADGKRITTDDYSFNAPDGWDEPKSPPSGFDFDAAVLDPDDKDGFADNINVIRVDPAPTDDLEAFEDGSVKELEDAKYTDVALQPRQKVDGTTAIHLTSAGKQNGIDYALNQFGILHEKVIYIVTFSFSADVAADDQEDLAQSVLASWKWAA